MVAEISCITRRRTRSPAHGFAHLFDTHVEFTKLEKGYSIVKGGARRNGSTNPIQNTEVGPTNALDLALWRNPSDGVKAARADAENRAQVRW